VNYSREIRDQGKSWVAFDPVHRKAASISSLGECLLFFLSRLCLSIYHFTSE
jgi:hypothetical protein